MIRIKAYIKWLSERGYLDQLNPSDVPINNIILQNPTYLTKQEIRQLMNYLEQRIPEVEATKCRRQYKYPAYMGRALVRMLYATGLRNEEIRSIRLQDIDLENMRGTVLGK